MRPHPTRPSTAAPSLLTLHVLWLAALLTAMAALTGCGMGPRLIPPASGASLHGHIHGGQQPVAGAKVFLLAANTSGYGQPSVSLLNAASTGYSDTLGAYVVSAADGTFDITGDYTCAPGAQVYLYASGGDPGVGSNNPVIGLMAVLGNCPQAGNFSSVPFVEVNEVSTIAAAYSLSAFASDATDIADDEGDLSNVTAASAKTGMANAFANAANLVDIGSGVALASTPAGNSSVPQEELNTLANILAACVNTNGSLSTTDSNDNTIEQPCGNLINATSMDGQPIPTDTAGAAINIAHHPAYNTDALWALPSSKPPFAPALASEPSDFTLTLAFTPTQLNVYAMAFDASGNLWYTYSSGIAELSPLGAEAPGSPFAANLVYPFSLAIDVSGDLWTADYSAQTLNEFSPSGSLLQTTAVTGLSYPTGLAFDPAGNLWISNLGSSVTKTDATGTLIATYTGNGTLSDPFQVLSDAAGNIWLPNPNDTNFVLLNNDGTANANSPLSASGVSPAYSNNPVAALDSTGNLWTLNAYSPTIGAISSSGSALPGIPFTPGNLPEGYYPQPDALTLDGHNNIWAAMTYEFEDDVHTGSPQPLSFHPNNFTGNINTLYGLTPSGNSLLAYILPGNPNGLAVDPSGNLWYAISGQGFFELLGVAAPVVTPIAAAVTANKIASLP